MTVQELAEWTRTASPEEVIGAARQSPAIHFATLQRIRDKENLVRDPVPNVFQVRISEAYEACQALGIACKIVGCKPRQVGASTFAGNLIRAHMKKFRLNGITISDVADNSKKLVNRLEEYETLDRMPWGVTMKPADSKGNIHFSNGSYMEIDSAENPKAGIGFTRQVAHFSEVGKWPKSTVKNDRATWNAVLQSVNEGENTVVIAESTPEGASGIFWETFDKALPLGEFLAALAEGRQPGNGWIRVFAAWHEFPEHVRAVSAGEAVELMRSLTDREREGVRRWNWTPEQIAWRRYTISSRCGGDEDAFLEYYPEDEVSCFLVSGRARFHQGMVAAMGREAACVQPETGRIQTVGRRWVWERTRAQECDFHVFEMPRPGYRYLMSIDPADGETQTKGKNPDCHAVQVWRRGYIDPNGATRRHLLAATIRPPCRWDADLVVSACVALNGLYGSPLTALEVNKGLHFLKGLEDAGVPLYRRDVIDPNNPDRAKPKRQTGFRLEDKHMRRAVIENFAALLRDGQVEILCPHMIQELKDFIVGADGKEQARPGAHDDNVMCAAMALYCIGGATLYEPEIRRRRLPSDFYDWARAD